MNILAFLKKKQNKEKKEQKSTNEVDSFKDNFLVNKKKVNNKIKQSINESNQRDDTQYGLVPKIKKNKKESKIQESTPKIKNRVTTQLQNQQTSKLAKKIINIDKFEDYKEYQSSQGEQQYKQIPYKYCIQLKKLLSTLQLIYQDLQKQYDIILKIDKKQETQEGQLIKRQLNSIKTLQLFRFQQFQSIMQIKKKYCQVLQFCELLISKLLNRIGKNVHFHKQIKHQLDQQKLNKIYVQNQQQFLLFFKHFFSKPYTLCNMPAMRKILQILWEFIYLENFNIEISFKKLSQSLKLWIYSISIPSNPTLITLHKLVIQKPEMTSKYCKMSTNQKIYLGINESDALGLTPLMVAAYSQNKKSLQKLLKIGAKPLICPLYVSQGKLTFTSSVTKYAKNLFAITFPINYRKQFNVLQILLGMKQYKLLSQCFYWMKLGQIKQFKKNKQILKQKIKQIPNGSFQIVWKTFKGILCFKQLPSDIIVIYKKNNMLRIDFHIDSIQFPQKGKHYSLIIKINQNHQEEFYQIRHHSKKKINRLKQVDMKQIFKKYENFIKFPHLQYERISSIKGMHSCSQSNVQISMKVELYQQQIPIKQFKQLKYKFKNSKDYQEQIISSTLLKYDQIQKSQLMSILNQRILNLNHPKIKTFNSKIQKSTLDIDLQLEQKKQLNFTHIKTVINLLSKNSFLLKKLQSILDILLNQQIIKKNNQNKTKSSLDICKMFPKTIKLHFQNSLNFQIDFKNLNFSELSDQVFSVQTNLKEQQQYVSEGDHIQNSLHSTILMDDGYSINVSRFLGKTERLFQFDEDQALKKYEKILQNNTMSQVLSDQEDDYNIKQ